MNDQALAQLAAEYKTAKERVAKAEERADKLKLKLVEELTRRETSGIITGGYKITLVSPTTVEYDERRLQKRLGKKWASVQKTVFDPGLLSELVQSGQVSPAVVASCSTVKPKKPYPLVNLAS